MPSAFRHPTRAARAVVIASVTVLAATLLPATGASAAAPPVVTKALFSMSDSQPAGTAAAGWPRVPVGAIRLWDTGVAWNQLEVSKGVFDFTRLKAIVATARAKGARPMLVLGQTPRFWALHTSQVGAYGAGAPSMPSRTAFRRYVRTVYATFGTTVDYQVWNEPNVQGYFKGTPRQMALLTKDVHDSLPARATVVAPSFPVRLSTQRAWFSKFYAQRPGGRKISAYVDYVAVNPYPLATGRPEDSMTLLRQAKSILRQHRISKIIWNTEINYGLTGLGTNARNISSRREAAYVARTYVLNAANRVRRVYWYSWDLHRLANVEMTTRNNASLTRAGLAFKVVQGWLVGARVRSCTADRSGTYTCVVTYKTGVRRVYWNPTRSTSVRAVGSATLWQGTLGATRKLRGGERVAVNYVPVMVRSRR